MLFESATQTIFHATVGVWLLRCRPPHHMYGLFLLLVGVMTVIGSINRNVIKQLYFSCAAQARRPNERVTMVVQLNQVNRWMRGRNEAKVIDKVNDDSRIIEYLVRHVSPEAIIWCCAPFDPSYWTFLCEQTMIEIIYQVSRRFPFDWSCQQSSYSSLVVKNSPHSYWIQLNDQILIIIL